MSEPNARRSNAFLCGSAPRARYTNSWHHARARLRRVLDRAKGSDPWANPPAPVSREIVLKDVSYQRTPFHAAEYERRTREGPCFICAIADGDPDYRGATAMIHEDSDVLIFLNRYPTLRGYTLVCPRRHVESVIAGFNELEYLALQRWIYRVGRAIEQVVLTERLYILSLGSQQGNRHVHWHIAPLPPGVPYAEQQLAALTMSHGILSLPTEEMARLAREIREALLAGT